MPLDYNLLLGNAPDPLSIAGNRLLAGMQGFNKMQQMIQERELAPLKQQLLQQRMAQGAQSLEQGQLGIEKSQAEIQANQRAMRQKAALYGMKRLRGLDLADRMKQAEDINRETQELFGSPLFDDEGPVEGQLTDQYLDNRISLMEPTAKREPFEQAKGKGLEGYSFDPNTGRYFVNQGLRSRIEKSMELSEKPKLDIGDISTINKDIGRLTKDARDIKAAASSLIKLEETSSPTDQLAAIFKFMKSLDPTSVVREGEQQMARSTGGPADAFVGYVNSIQGEGGLTPTAFKNMVETGKSMANSAIESSRDASLDYLDVFAELDPDRRRRLENRIPDMFEVELTEEQQIQDNAQQTQSAIVDKYRNLPPDEQARFLNLLTNEEKKALGLDRGNRRGRNK